jgi:hypothetical protein
VLMLGFRECLELVLGQAVPEAAPGVDAEIFWSQWLAQRNLGLVPVAEPERFSRAGAWIALFGPERRAVALFGSPPGPILDPTGVLADGERSLRAGFVVAPLDLRAPQLVTNCHELEAAGTVEAVLVAPRREAPLVPVESALALPGRGLDGDRYAADAGTFTRKGHGYDLTLVEAEALEALDPPLPWAEARRNVVTRGIGLDALLGRRFAIGAVECFGRRRNEPCAHLERLTRPGLLRGLVHRGGLRADILTPGTIAPGDEIRSL